MHYGILGSNIYTTSLAKKSGTTPKVKNYITTYYKGLFGPPDNNNCNSDATRTDDIPQVTDVENEMLTSGFTEVEVRGYFLNGT